MDSTASIEVVPGESISRPERFPRLLRVLSDERLVQRVRTGSEAAASAAFSVLYERHHRKLLSFCRHMLGSHEEAEDAVQQTFVNAYRDLGRGDKELHVRPWLYRIARNQCIDFLRGRRGEEELGEEPSLHGLGDEVETRAELRALLGDLARLPVAQREALVLAELHDNSHSEVAEILRCDREKVKSLVFQARASLQKSRQARELPCEEVQRQLSALRGGSLRRSHLRRHLDECDRCRAFRAEVKRQRAAFALVLPVAPSPALKVGAGTILAAAKAAGGGAAGSAASGAAASGAAASGIAGAAALKVAVATVAVTAVAGTAGVEVKRQMDREPARPAAGASARPAENRVVKGFPPRAGERAAVQRQERVKRAAARRGRRERAVAERPPSRHAPARQHVRTGPQAPTHGRSLRKGARPEPAARPKPTAPRRPAERGRGRPPRARLPGVPPPKRSADPQMTK